MTPPAASRKQRELTDWIAQFVYDHGYPPTQREMAQGMGVTVGSINSRIDRAVLAGLLTRGEGPRTVMPALPAQRHPLAFALLERFEPDGLAPHADWVCRLTEDEYNDYIKQIQPHGRGGNE